MPAFSVYAEAAGVDQMPALLVLAEAAYVVKIPAVPQMNNFNSSGLMSGRRFKYFSRNVKKRPQQLSQCKTNS